MTPATKVNLTFVVFIGCILVVMITTIRHPFSTDGQAVEVYINHFNKKRHNNVLKIEKAYCKLKYVKSITVLCAGPACFEDGEFTCSKTRSRRVDKNLFDRFQECASPRSLHLSNDDDLVLNQWALNTMVAHARVNPNSIVGPYGRRANPNAKQEYSNPWYSVGENVALTNAALIPCKIIPLWRKWTKARDYIAHAKGGCEDILLNMLSNELFRPALVEPKWELLRNIDTKLPDNSGGLHGTAKGNWDGYRNECVRWGAREVPRFKAEILG
jgi:hypothetical protein